MPVTLNWRVLAVVISFNNLASSKDSLHRTQGGKSLFVKKHKTAEKHYTRLPALRQSRAPAGGLQDFTVWFNSFKENCCSVGSHLQSVQWLKKSKANNVLPTSPKFKKRNKQPPQKSWGKQMREKWDNTAFKSLLLCSCSHSGYFPVLLWWSSARKKRSPSNLEFDEDIISQQSKWRSRFGI